MINKTIETARIIMYRNIESIFPDATLIDDNLDGESYIGTWDSEANQLILYSFCDRIFDNGAKVLIAPV